MNITPDTIRRELTHGQMLAKHLAARRPHLPPNPVLVETGCGRSTLYLAESGRALNATVYSCDMNAKKVAALKQRAGDRLKNVIFMVGDSHDSLKQITGRHPQLDFVFLDAAASAMHTFQEFQIIEPFLKPGASLLIDNAALPNTRVMLSPCRKGKIIVPYLLASAWWEVTGHPTAGDSMVSAVRHERPDFADTAFEWPEFVDAWEADFARGFDQP
jgi:SAM-dependent methyltransferase